MRIAAAEVALDSAASSSRYKEVRETLTEGFVRAGDTFNRQNLVAGTHRERVEREVVTEVRETQASYNDPRQVIAKQDLGKYSFDQLLGKRDSAGPSLFELSPEDKVKIELLKKLFESLTGKRFSVGMLDLQGSGGGGSGVQTSAQSSNAELNISSGVQRPKQVSNMALFITTAKPMFLSLRFSFRPPVRSKPLMAGPST